MKELGIFIVNCMYVYYIFFLYAHIYFNSFRYQQVSVRDFVQLYNFSGRKMISWNASLANCKCIYLTYPNCKCIYLTYPNCKCIYLVYTHNSPLWMFFVSFLNWKPLSKRWRNFSAAPIPGFFAAQLCIDRGSNVGMTGKLADSLTMFGTSC